MKDCTHIKAVVLPIKSGFIVNYLLSIINSQLFLLEGGSIGGPGHIPHSGPCCPERWGWGASLFSGRFVARTQSGTRLCLSLHVAAETEERWSETAFSLLGFSAIGYC